MPVPAPAPVSGNFQVIIANRAQDVPNFAIDTLRQYPVKANLILPTLEKRLAQHPSTNTSNSELWIIVHSNYVVNFIASVTQGYMGNYPLFIFTPIPYPYLLSTNIRPAVTLLAQAFLRSVHRARIYSVFAPQVVAETFAGIWTSLTNIRVSEPYYHAYISYLTARSFINREIPAVPGASCELRPATMGDLNDVGELCYLFASDSAPFFLDRNGALREAEYLIKSRQCWVYAVTRPHQPTKLACLVAYTRNTDNSATITKVITHHRFRKLGCAEKLVRKVCASLLGNKQSVALFVGIDNPAANVYRKVGFIGIGEGAQPTQDIDPYIELGFDRNHVQLGHW